MEKYRFILEARLVRLTRDERELWLFLKTDSTSGAAASESVWDPSFLFTMQEDTPVTEPVDNTEDWLLFLANIFSVYNNGTAAVVFLRRSLLSDILGG